MLLRSITKHVKDQNWFAVALDFLIVVVGILIAFQITNWNEERADKLQEAAILAQLEDEFVEIQNALEKQIVIRQGYTTSLAALISSLEGNDALPEDNLIKQALRAARSTGRRPAESAAYVQLTASGDLARLSNDNLKQALIRYHTRLERDAFIFPELMRMVVQEMSANAFVNYNIQAVGAIGAAIDAAEEMEKIELNKTLSYDFEGLRQYEQRYETLYVMHAALVNTEQTQLDLVNEILKQISEEHQ